MKQNEMLYKDRYKWATDCIDSVIHYVINQTLHPSVITLLDDSHWPLSCWNDELDHCRYFSKQLSWVVV